MENEREQINDGSMLTAANDTQTVCGMKVRPMSLATAAVLRRLENPLYLAMMAGQEIDGNALDAEDILQYIWVHAADWQTVRSLAVNAPYRKEEVAAAVLDFGLNVRPDDLRVFLEHISGTAVAVQAATAETLPDELTGGESKN